VRSGEPLALLDPKGPLTVKIVKRLAIVLIVGFALFYLITRPHDAANAVQGAVDAVWGAVMAVTNFFVELANG
jgi:hypothetical protein